MAADRAYENWTSRPLPPRQILLGRYCRLEPLDAAKHAKDLVEAYRETDRSSWRYLFSEPFESDSGCERWLADVAARQHEIFYALIGLESKKAVAVMSYMRIDPGHGVIEIGNIHYSDGCKKTRAATESMYLLMRHAFEDLGYRRYEWKCDSLNAPSRAAAIRLGFQFEGIFRQHMIVKGFNRDTAWFAITDEDWPRLKRAYEKWLEPRNFDKNGVQRIRLTELIKAEARG